jgi:hypothetical protein
MNEAAKTDGPLTLRGLGRALGMSDSYLAKLRKKGIISESSTPGPHGPRYDYATAVAEIEAAADPTKESTRQRWREYRGETPEKPTAELASFQAAKTRKEHYLADMAQLDYELKKGKTIDAEQAAHEIFTVMRILRDALLALPDRVAATLAVEDDAHKIHSALRAEVVAVLDDCCERLNVDSSGD